MAVLFSLIAPFSLCGAEMSQENQRKEAERIKVQRLLEPYVKSGFAEEAGGYAKALAEYQRAVQSYPPKPEKPQLHPTIAEFWKKMREKYGEDIRRGLFYLLFRPEEVGGNIGVSSLMHAVFRDGSYSCRDFLDFASDKGLTSGMRRYALSYVKECMKKGPTGLAAEVSRFAGEEEGDEVVRTMALGILSQTNEAGSGPAATFKLLQSEDLRDVTLAIPALWKRPNPAALPALRRALAKARAARPYPMESVRTITGGIVACRGTESVERDIYNAMGDALFWDYRFPDTTPPGLLTNIIGPLENSIHTIGSPVSVEYLIRVYIHGGIWGSQLDVGHFLPRYLKDLHPAIVAELNANSPRAKWSIWACVLSRDERCLPELRKLVYDPRKNVARAAVDALGKMEGGQEFPVVHERLAEFDVITMKEVLDLGNKVEVIKPSPDRRRFTFIRRLADENGSWVVENDLRIRKLAEDSILWTAAWLDSSRMAVRGKESLTAYTVVDVETGRRDAVDSGDWGHLDRQWFAITIPDAHQERIADFIVDNFYPTTTLDEAVVSPDGKHLAFVLRLPGQQGMFGAAFVHDVGTDRFRTLGPRVGQFIWRGNDLIFVEGVLRSGANPRKSGKVFAIKL